MTDLFQKLMERRGLSEDFLHPKYEDLSDPLELPDMTEAVARLKQAAETGERVIIYGDYDVDGATASAIMAETLDLIGVKNFRIMLPSRFEDGYGMSEKIVTVAKKTGVKLVVTVDCGSNNEEIVKKLGEIGVDVVVTDHHEISGELPKAVAVVNPKREDFRKRILERQTEIIEKKAEKDLAGLAELCGAGIAFMVARACVKQGWIKDGREKWLLDLAAIGTVCDAMRLTGDNRIICYYGMIVLGKKARPGLKELMRVARIGEINTDTIGFQIGPRLNAAGRMESAELALRLLRAKSGPEAAKMASELNSLNNERKKQQETATREIAETGVGNEQVLVVQGPWHEGVLGIIAGRLLETYKRPCFVISSENGKGSGRSFGDFNLALAIKECQDELVKGGGHAEACGVTVKPGKIDDFRRKVNDYYNSLRLHDQERFLLPREDLALKRLDELTLDFMDEMELLAPFGAGNSEPVFLAEKMLVSQVRRMGMLGQHVSIVVSYGEGKIFRLVAFNAPEEWLKLQAGEIINAWLTPMINGWRGEKVVEGRLLRVETVDMAELF